MFSDDFPLGAIVSQNMPEGTEVPRGSDVVGRRCRAAPTSSIFPDISAATTFEQAAAILTPAGFQPVLTFGDAQGAIQSVTIDGQPPSGRRAPIGAAPSSSSPPCSKSSPGTSGGYGAPVAGDSAAGGRDVR